MKISLVPVEHTPFAWNEVRHYLEPAIERSDGRWTMEHLCAAVLMGSTQLWVAFDDQRSWGCVTTEITSYPAKKVLSMHFLGGEQFGSWYNLMLEQLTAYAIDMGCESIEGVARFGFWKFLKADGFKKSSAFYEKKLR